MLLMSLYYAREIKVETSIVAEVIYPFRLCTPMEDTHNRGLRPHWHHYPRPRRVIPDDPYKIVDRLMNLQRPNKEMIELARFCDMFWKGEGIKQSLDVVMAAVSLHIDREITLPSELFGLLGDAPIQMIDCYDSVRLESFEVWSQQCTEIKEPGIHKLFQLFKSPHFQMSVIDWEKKAEWAIIAHMWHFDHVDNSNDGFTGNKDGPGSAWLPYLPPGQIQYLNMVDYSPNENHPWVIKTRKIMPELCPQIMVRLCTNRCDVKKKTERGWRSYGISKRQRRFFQHGSL